MANAHPKTISVSLQDLSKMIDHSLLHPTLTDRDVENGLEICKKYNVATGKRPLISRIFDSNLSVSNSLCKTIPHSLRQEAA